MLIIIININNVIRVASLDISKPSRLKGSVIRDRLSTALKILIVNKVSELCAK